MSASTEPVASIVLTVLLMAALATRLGIEPPTIIAERQYRSALIARSYFFAHHPVPEWRRRVAAAAIAEQDRLEPGRRRSVLPDRRPLRASGGRPGGDRLLPVLTTRD
jgi:hypothetical protein